MPQPSQKQNVPSSEIHGVARLPRLPQFGGALLVAALVSGCVVVPVEVERPSAETARNSHQVSGGSVGSINTPRVAARSFVTVLNRMEPVVEQECRARRTAQKNCDFMFVVDDRPELPPNAFQTLDANGRPVVGFTLALIAEAQNSDELAFVVGHEAAHHVLDHLPRQGNAATAGAVILGGIAAAYGGNTGMIQSAQRIGATVGSRYFSKEWELQADYMGAVIAQKAGYDPEHGAEFFTRLPDPGNRVLGTHPPNAARRAEVARAIADVKSGRAQ